MVVNLSPETQQLIEARMKAGGFSTADEAIRAALISWEQIDVLDEFAPGELEALIAEGEESLKRDGPLSHGQVFGAIRADLEARRKPK